MDETHIYDSVFKTTAHKLPRLMVPLVNEAFGRSHDAGACVERMPESFLERYGLREADAVFSIGDVVYHLECQSTADPSMPIRMLEYDSAIAFGLARGYRAELDAVIKFPRSCVVYLRGVPASANVPLIVEFPGNQRVNYMPKAVDACSYAPADIAARNLYALAPFSSMRHDLNTAKPDAACLLAEAVELEKAMHEALREYEYNTRCYLYTEVARHVLRCDRKLAEEVESIMNGRILELPDEKIARLERERDNAALERDAAARERDNVARERDNDRRAFVGLLHKAGVSDDEIAKALAAEGAAK